MTTTKTSSQPTLTSLIENKEPKKQVKKHKPIEVQQIIDEFNLDFMEYNFINDARESKNSQTKFFDSDNFNAVDPSLAMRERNSRWITFNIPAIDTLSRSNPLVKKAVNYLSSKPLVNGIDINLSTTKLTSEQMFEILQYDRNLYASKKDILSKGYLYGGAAGLMWFDGQEDAETLKTPLVISKIKKGSFKGIKPLSRWFQIEPALELPLIGEVGGDTGFEDARVIGMPEFYHVSLSGGLSGDTKNSRFLVHASRLLLFTTETPSYIETQVERYWGASLIELAWNDLLQDKRLWSATTKSAEKNNMGVLKVDGLALAGSVNKNVRNRIMARMELIKYGSSKNIVPIDAKDEFEFVQAVLSGQSDVLKLNNSRVAGALKVPVSVLYPNSEADKEDSSYIQSLAELNDTQERILRDWYRVLLSVIIKSLTNVTIKNIMFSFNPIETTTLKEKAEVAKLNSETLKNLWDMDGLDEESLIKAIDDIGKDPATISQNISQEYRDFIKEQREKGEFVTSTTKKLEIAEQLNSMKENSSGGLSGVDNPASELGGKESGGNPKETKKPLKRNVLNPDKGKKQ